MPDATRCFSSFTIRWVRFCRRAAELEARYHQELRDGFGVEFDHLLTITNMPIKRFADQLRRVGSENEYMGLLVNHFNPGDTGDSYVGTW